MVEGNPAEEDDDFEVELGVVDVVSVALALAVVSVGFNAVVSDSIFGNGSSQREGDGEFCF